MGPLLVAGIVLATLAVYGRTVTFDFCGLDDPGYVSENPRVLGGLTGDGVLWAFTTTEQFNWHPLSWLSLMLDATLGAARPGVFHFTNVVLHAANVVLLFWILLRMTSATLRSAFVAGLFALHPLHVESVAWIAERKDVLSTLFGFLAIVLYLRYVESPTRWRYAAVVLSYALGLLAKPMLVALPIVLLVLDFWPLGRVARAGRGRLLREKLPLLALAGLSALATLHAQSAGGAVRTFEMLSFGTRAANAVVSYVEYARLLLWPADLAVQYPYDLAVLGALPVAASALLLLAVSSVALATARSRPYLLAGWLWYVITLLPVSGLIQVGAAPRADRYTYVPLVGLFIMVAWGVPDLLRASGVKERLARASLGLGGFAVLLTLALATHVQVATWRDAGTLFTHALAVDSRNFVAHHGLALQLLRSGRPADAIGHLRESLRLWPSYVEARVSLAEALANAEQLEEAAEQYGQAARGRPIDPEIRSNHASLLLRLGRIEEAEAGYREALRLRPADAKIRANLGAALLRLDRPVEAEAEIRAALRVDPAQAYARELLALALKNLGVLRARQGRFDEAIAHLEEALEIDPADAGARLNLERARRMRSDPRSSPRETQ